MTGPIPSGFPGGAPPQQPAPMAPQAPPVGPPQAPMVDPRAGQLAEPMPRPHSPDADTTADRLADSLSRALEAGERAGLSQEAALERIAQHFDPGRPPARGSDAPVPGAPSHTADPLGVRPWGQQPGQQTYQPGQPWPPPVPQQQGYASRIESAEQYAQQQGVNPWAPVVAPQQRQQMPPPMAGQPTTPPAYPYPQQTPTQPAVPYPQQMPGGQPGQVMPPQPIQVGDRQMTMDQIQTAIRLADRASRIDQTYRNRMAELEAREQQINAREGMANQQMTQAQAMQELAWRDPERYQQLVQAMSGQGGSDSGDFDGDFDPRSLPPMSAEQRPVTAAEVQEMLSSMQLNSKQEQTQQGFYSMVDRTADELIRSNPVFNTPEAQRNASYLAGLKLRQDLELGAIRLPNLKKNDRGSSPEEVRDALALHISELAQQRQAEFHAYTAGLFQQQNFVQGGMPAPSLGGATVMPGQHMQAEHRRVPDDIEGVISELDQITSEMERAGPASGLPYTAAYPQPGAWGM